MPGLLKEDRNGGARAKVLKNRHDQLLPRAKDVTMSLTVTLPQLQQKGPEEALPWPEVGQTQAAVMSSMHEYASMRLIDVTY